MAKHPSPTLAPNFAETTKNDKWKSVFQHRNVTALMTTDSDTLFSFCDAAQLARFEDESYKYYRIGAVSGAEIPIPTKPKLRPKLQVSEDGGGSGPPVRTSNWGFSTG